MRIKKEIFDSPELVLHPVQGKYKMSIQDEIALRKKLISSSLDGVINSIQDIVGIICDTLNSGNKILSMIMKELKTMVFALN